MVAEDVIEFQPFKNALVSGFWDQVCTSSDLPIRLNHKPPSILIDDPAAPATWCFDSGATYLSSVQPGRPIDHPLKGLVALRWRS